MLLALLMITEQSFSQVGKDKQIMDSNKVVELVQRIKYEVASEQVGNFPKVAKEALEQFSINGYYRFVGNYRELSKAYDVNKNNPNNLFIGDSVGGNMAAKKSAGAGNFLTAAGVGNGIEIVFESVKIGRAHV